ncbi:hypothetical protein [Salinibacter ruber]|uniref:Uncharacterized protein n=1 Tax=Salinibacter ruber TaxID=146919 RepID=A0A9X2QFM0_9BACT|nr:hypothetical protein [Salinibacter ruber]MCS3661736.1 hypothetical protein [Salinibacter ruber]MCS3711603.1 hypothetical protein [Salinibacter ruber]
MADTVVDMVDDEVIPRIHPKLRNFEPSDIGIFFPGDDQENELLTGFSQLTFFLHPSMNQYHGRPKVRHRLSIYFIETKTNMNGEKVCRSDKIIRVPSEMYEDLYPSASLLVELPF